MESVAAASLWSEKSKAVYPNPEDPLSVEEWRFLVSHAQNGLVI